ncbi:MAG: hypothetical protein K8R59_17915 [Thermoanaerobaculales bacterium]|nr:hypothetical protein [Thermoanaerobaculales bacterium]
MTSIREQAPEQRLSLETLQDQHQGHEERLEELRQKVCLTPDEELEEKTLKKLKLNVKDRMELLRRSPS